MKIYNKEIPTEFIELVIEKVKSKKELSNLDDHFIIEYMTKFLEQNTKLINLIQKSNDLSKLQKNTLFNELVKYVRKEFRFIYGMFQKPSEINKRKLLLNEFYTSDDKKKLLSQILNTHVSTKERIDIYDELIIKLEEITSGHKNINIIDLGAGINPIALFDLIKDKKVNYVASELNVLDTTQLNEYFSYIKSINKDFNGVAYSFDLRKDYNLIGELTTKHFSNDGISICFMFKIIELLEGYKKHFSFNIFNNLKDIDYFIVTFPKITLGRTRTSNVRRLWFESMLEKLNLRHERFEFDSELFYICKK